MILNNLLGFSSVSGHSFFKKTEAGDSNERGVI